MAYAFEPINLEAMKALQPFAVLADGYTVDIADATVVRLTITVGQLRYARRVWNLGSDYKYDDRSKVINACANAIGSLEGITDPAQRQIKRQAQAAALALLPVYVQPPTG